MIFVSRVTFLSSSMRAMQDAPIGGDLPWLSGGISAAECVAAYHANGASSQAGSYVNLANPGTYNITAGNAPAWDATNGWTFTAASLHNLRTGLTPAVDQTWSALVQYTSGENLANKTIFGAFRTTGADGTFLLQTGVSTMVSFNGSTSASRANTPFLTNGVYGFAGRTAYRNGVAESLLIPASAGTGAYEIYIGALNFNNSPAQYSNIKIQKVYVYNTTRTAAQMLALTNAMIAA